MEAVVFDRDGTLINFVHYLSNPSEVQINKDILPTLRFLTLLPNIKLFVHTNQSGVERGMFNISDVEKCNNKLFKILKTNFLIDFNVERIFIAPTFDSKYRKPTNFVALEIEKLFNIKPSSLIYIGDTIVDYQSAIDSNSKCIIYRGKASKPLSKKLNIDEEYLVYNELDLKKKVENFVYESND